MVARSSRYMLLCLALITAAYPIFIAASGCTPTITLDLSARPGIPHELHVEHPQHRCFQLINRLPWQEYELRWQGRSTPIPSTSPRDSTPPVALTCRSLSRDANGNLTRATSEAQVAAEVARMIEIARGCEGAAQKIQAAIEEKTTTTIAVDASEPEPNKASSPATLTSHPPEQAENWVPMTIEVRRAPHSKLAWHFDLTQCHWRTNLHHALEQRYPGAVGVLAYQHRERQWSAFRWTGNELQDVQTTFRPDLTPRWELLPDEQLVVFAVDTNPLMFQTKPGAVTIGKSEEAEDLEAFSRLIASFLGSSFKIAGERQGDAEAGLAALPAGDLLANKYLEPFESIRSDGNDDNDREKDDDAKEGVKEDAKLTPFQEIVNAVTAQLRVQAKGVADAQSTMSMSTGHLLADVRQVERQRRRFLGDLQEVERGVLQPPIEAPHSASTLDKHFDHLEKAHESLASKSACCRKEAQALDRLAQIKLELPTSKNQDALRLEYELLAFGLTQPEKAPEPPPELMLAITEAAEWFNENPGAPSSSTEKRALLILRHNLQSFEAILAGREAALTAGREILGTRTKVQRSAAAPLLLWNSVLGRAPSYDACSLARGVIELPGPPVRGADLKLNETREVNFSIVPQGDLAQEVATSRAAAESKYLVQKVARGELDIDFGLVYTSLSAPEFGAVTAPSATNPERLQIAEIDEETRAGKLALFATWMPRRGLIARPFGYQLGFGLDTDNPAAFVGIGWKPSAYVRLSAGATLQQVKELDNQRIGEEVGQETDIRLHDSLDAAPYFSLSLSIGDLPFFKPEPK